MSSSAHPLLWPMLLARMPLETGLEFLEADEVEPEAGVEEAARVLITAACLR